MKAERTMKITSIFGLAVAAVFTITACASTGEPHETSNITQISTTETTTAAPATTTATTSTMTSTTKVVETETATTTTTATEISTTEIYEEETKFADSEKEKVLKGIEGLWTTVGNSGLISKTFKGDVVENSNGGSNKIKDVKRFSNSDGEGYKIFLDNGIIYYLFDEDPEYLECHWEPDGPDNYSGSDSLGR